MKPEKKIRDMIKNMDFGDTDFIFISLGSEKKGKQAFSVDTKINDLKNLNIISDLFQKQKAIIIEHYKYKEIQNLPEFNVMCVNEIYGFTLGNGYKVVKIDFEKDIVKLHIDKGNNITDIVDSKYFDIIDYSSLN